MAADTARKPALGIDDYLAIPRRRALMITMPALGACLAALGISFLVTPSYTSQSLLQVERQVVPAGYVRPIVTERVTDRMAVLQSRVLSRSSLVALVERLESVASSQSHEMLIQQIRSNVSVRPAYPSTSSSTNKSVWQTKPVGNGDDVPGFFVSFTAENPRKAQQICDQITFMLLDENFRHREQAARTTTDFLGRQLDDAKHGLDELDNKLAQFKKRHLGQLPTDVENNAKVLSGLDTQLETNAHTLGHAEQDKAFAESLLAQEEAAWKASRVSPNVPSLREQLVTLSNHLISLQSRYTDDHPDVVKAENDIAEAQHQLQELTAKSNSGDPPNDDKAQLEPQPILHLRHQINEDQGLIERATEEQVRLKKLIESYQSRLVLSPDVEERYKQLTRDNETARTIYDGLLADKVKAEIQAAMEHEQQGEQLKLLEAADFPAAPSFPNRWLFAGGGLGAGLGIGLGLALLVEMRDRSVRREEDVIALLEVPMLAFVPWAPSTAGDGHQRRGLRERIKPLFVR